MDWQTILMGGVAVVALLSRSFDKSLSIREHDEFRKGIERTTDGLQQEYRREIDRLEARLLLIEQTRPTAGELQQISTGIKEQISELKLAIRAT